MKLGYVHGQKMTQQYDHLEAYAVDEIFSDADRGYAVLQEQESEFQRLLDYSEAGDYLVVSSLDVLSRDYEFLLELIDRLSALELELIVLTSPHLRVQEWQEILTWVNKNERLLHPKLISFKRHQEKKKDKDRYTIFSRASEEKSLYWEVFWLLVGKQKIRMIAKEKGVPIETVFRIQQEVKRIKLAVIFAICFFLAITTIKIAESFSDNIWIQIVVCIITTVVILYNVLTDSEQNL
ncbi:recombinase family protein [Enterococcus termitis]|uniref:Resolvase/invertase-type recombinase catalytic domain-containing protein n=1 Tax=Enterococcus termitis TaxID=332950 RepID=A0A1E5GB91_9ENTE|nr:recombinase family protein [Enterococcus termitis]OEG09959.1 hypothetical protein BCR25_10705 [Enterococcus termitis]OJG98483.1 hypothetical protein RV18_GL003384 [Enterococcus termitis]